MATNKATPDEGVNTATPRGPAGGDGASRFAVATWASDVGKWSGIIILVVILLVFVFFVLAATKVLFLAALFAVLFAGTFLPMVDWLEKHHIKRGLGAIIVTVLLILLGVAIGALIVYSVLKQIPTIDAKLSAAWADIQKTLKSTSVSQDQIDSIKNEPPDARQECGQRARRHRRRPHRRRGEPHLRPVHQPQHPGLVPDPGARAGPLGVQADGAGAAAGGLRILANSARFFRGYLYGSTLVGLFNGAVLGVGALVIGVPLAGTIFVVGWFTNYIPFFGAIISGAFAVLIALGSGGPSKAVPMLIIVIISNGYLQTIVSQFALGSALKLHPLAVLFATTAGSALFGAVGGVFAAPFLEDLPGRAARR